MTTTITVQQRKQILDDGVQPPPFQKWTNEDEQMLYDRESREIDLGDTAYGRLQALKERELNATVLNMSREKRDELRMKFDAMDAEEIQQQSSDEHDNTTPL